jgi:hypothetical protein
MSISRGCSNGLDGVGRDLVELDAVVGLAVERHRLEQVPGDGLALAVGVSGEVDGAGLPGGLLQPLDDVLLVLGDDVFRREVVLDVDPEL